MTHTAKQMQPAIGQIIEVGFESISIHCKVLDVKSAWGKIRLLIKPFSGNGEQWIELSRVIVTPVNYQARNAQQIA